VWPRCLPLRLGLGDLQGLRQLGPAEIGERCREEALMELARADRRTLASYIELVLEADVDEAVISSRPDEPVRIISAIAVLTCVVSGMISSSWASCHPLAWRLGRANECSPSTTV